MQMHNQLEEFTGHQGQPMAKDTSAERFDHFAMDFEPRMFGGEIRKTKLFEDSMDFLKHTACNQAPDVSLDNCLGADYFDKYRLPGQLDDIFDLSASLPEAQTAY